jgi:hypothetical protein
LTNHNHTNSGNKKYIFCFISIIALTIYATIAIKFVWHDNLSSFASDSANYMLMALYLSPWEEAPLPIQSLWSYQEYPPLFPFLLALTGVVHNMIAAHVFTLSILIAALPLIYLFAKQCFATKWQALFITSIFVISPSAWMNILGILSENLYILLSFLILFLFQKQKIQTIKMSVIFGILLSALMLTRTIGIAMFTAYLLSGFSLYKRKEINKIIYLIPVFITILINGIAKLLHQSSIPSQYLRQLRDLEFGNQFNAIIDAWFSSWQFYWVDNLILPYAIILMTGLLACCGLLYRLITLQFDAIYIAVYLLILLLWPHSGQALRFIYPIQAILLIYAFYFLDYLFKKYSSTAPYKPIAILLLLMSSVVVPPLSFAYNRYNVGSDNGYNHIKEFYRFPDLKKAQINAGIQTTMFNDMVQIRNNTNKNDLILYFSSTYVALLANRKSKDITFNYIDENSYTVDDISDADYIYLSRLHPRKTRENINGVATLEYFSDNTEIVWTHYSNENNEPVSIFLKVIK